MIISYSLRICANLRLCWASRSFPWCRVGSVRNLKLNVAWESVQRRSITSDQYKIFKVIYLCVCIGLMSTYLNYFEVQISKLFSVINFCLQ